ncbi:hypothetical protein Tco_0579021 [Tanacetum coccineum]
MRIFDALTLIPLETRNESLQDEIQQKVSVSDVRITNLHNELRASLQKMDVKQLPLMYAPLFAQFNYTFNAQLFRMMKKLLVMMHEEDLEHCLEHAVSSYHLANPGE